MSLLEVNSLREDNRLKIWSQGRRLKTSVLLGQTGCPLKPRAIKKIRETLVAKMKLSPSS